MIFSDKRYWFSRFYSGNDLLYQIQASRFPVIALNWLFCKLSKFMILKFRIFKFGLVLSGFWFMPRIGGVLKFFLAIELAYLKPWIGKAHFWLIYYLHFSVQIIINTFHSNDNSFFVVPRKFRNHLGELDLDISNSKVS